MKRSFGFELLEALLRRGPKQRLEVAHQGPNLGGLKFGEALDDFLVSVRCHLELFLIISRRQAQIVCHRPKTDRLIGPARSTTIAKPHGEMTRLRWRTRRTSPSEQGESQDFRNFLSSPSTKPSIIAISLVDFLHSLLGKCSKVRSQVVHDIGMIPFHQRPVSSGRFDV